MKLKPAKSCICLDFVVGVEIINLFMMTLHLYILSAACGGSFKDTVAGVWGLLGIPMTIIGGVSVLYRIEYTLRYYLNYLMATPIVYLLTLPLACALPLLPVLLVFIYFVWSACEAITEMDYPHLMAAGDLKQNALWHGENPRKAPAAIPPTRTHWLSNPSWRNGTPQSFIPAPTPSFLPQSMPMAPPVPPRPGFLPQSTPGMPGMPGGIVV
jgi:hypothetical protein